MTRKITDTAAQVREEPMMTLLQTLSGGIEAQERHGQRELVNSEQLPTKGSEDPAWAKMGVIYGPMPLAGKDSDPLFRQAILPEGWKKVSTDHSMWTKLVDDKGRTRATMFYKAAFYDRDAFINTVRRFNVNRVYDKDDYDLLQIEVTDCGVRVFVTDPEKRTHPTGEQDWTAFEEAEKVHLAACHAWLAERFPSWKDVTAHWD